MAPNPAWDEINRDDLMRFLEEDGTNFTMDISVYRINDGFLRHTGILLTFKDVREIVTREFSIDININDTSMLGYVSGAVEIVSGSGTETTISIYDYGGVLPRNYESFGTLRTVRLRIGRGVEEAMELVSPLLIPPFTRYLPFFTDCRSHSSMAAEEIIRGVTEVENQAAFERTVQALQETRNKDRSFFPLLNSSVIDTSES